MNTTPTTLLLQRAIESACDGSVKQYLVNSSKSSSQINERTLRNGFSDLRSQASRSSALPHAFEMIRQLNGYYRTRYAIEKLRALTPMIYSAIEARNWWRSGPPNIADAAPSDIDSLASVVPSILHDAEKDGLDRPYSLITKFLHFSFQDSFGIYDAQAANSIQTWGYFTFELGNPEGKAFLWGGIANVNGNGYRAIIDFYRILWLHGSEEQLRRLELAAHDLTLEIQAPVSSTYIVDNLLWQGNGDPRVLGLL